MKNIDKEKQISNEVDEFLESKALVSRITDKFINHVKKEERRLKTLMVLKWAVVMVFIAGIASLLVMQLSSAKPEVLFLKYYKTFGSSTGVRSINEAGSIEHVFDEAMQAYNDEKYKEAVQMFKRVIEENANNNLAVFLSAICFIELDKPADAIKNFEKLLKKNESNFVEPVNWYLGLSYLKLKNKDAARQYFQKLLEYQNVYSERSNKILKKIKK